MDVIEGGLLKMDPRPLYLMETIFPFAIIGNFPIHISSQIFSAYSPNRDIASPRGRYDLKGTLAERIAHH